MAISLLLVDDDNDFTTMLRTLLQGQDFQIHTSSGGDEAVLMCRSMPLDVIILDLLMPGMDGWEVCRRIRSFSDVPILILSALGAPANVARALDAGADDYLIKPVHASVLTSRLMALVRRAALKVRIPAA